MMNSLLLASVLVIAAPQASAHPLANVDPVDEETSPYPGRPARIPGGVLANVTPVDGMSDLDDDDAAAPAVVRCLVTRKQVWFKETRCLTERSGGRTRTTCKVVSSGWRDATSPAKPARPVRPAPAPAAPDADVDVDVEVPPPAPGAPAEPVAPAAPRVTTGMGAQERAVIGLLNQARLSVGLPAVTADSAAAKVARAHSQDMCSQRYFSHQSPEGKAPWDRLRKGGVKFRAAAENIAAGQATAAAVHASWMRSAGHFANRMNRDYTRIGVGVVDCNGTPYWTEVFTR